MININITLHILDHDVAVVNVIMVAMMAADSFEAFTFSCVFIALVFAAAAATTSLYMYVYIYIYIYIHIYICIDVGCRS